MLSNPQDSFDGCDGSVLGDLALLRLRKGEGVLEECEPVKVTQEEDLSTPGYGIGFVSGVLY